MAAFEAALNVGAGIECDLRLTADGVPIVFHDRDSHRLTGEFQICSTSHLPDLAHLRLNDTDQHIPSLAELLDLAAGRVPLLLELKEERNAPRFATAVVAALHDYSGPVGVMSFVSRVGQSLAAQAPSVRRGQVLSGRDALLRRDGKLKRSQPHFLAVKVSELHKPWVHAVRADTPIYSWTVHTPDDRAKVERWADAAIWEGDGRP
jgi:glycerophosphoryl diester phosphodiesterase